MLHSCLVEPGDIAGLTSVLRRLAADTAWRVKLADGAHRRGEQLPTWADTADAVFGALRRLLPAPG